MKMGSWKKFLILLVMAFVIGLAACQGGDDTSNEGETQVEENESSEETSEEEAQDDEESAASESVTLTDKSGEEVTIEEEPERVVTVIPSATEIVYAVGGGDKVVGVDEWSNYPEEVTDIEKVGDMNLNFEKIVELEPDLVVADLNNGDDIQALRDKGLKVIVLGAQTLEETYEDLRLAGQAVGTEEKANETVENMQNRIEEIEKKTAELSEDEKKSVWFEIDQELFTAAENTFMNELLQIAGGKNIMAGEEGWPQVNEEVVIEANPDVIITTYGYYMEDVEEQVLARENWKDVTAIQNEEVHNIDNDLLSRPGPRLIEGLEQLVNILYPDLME
ncbi:ABC transporter substrate-binding protein [Allobacillus halotolerans]|uniref:ABC transporter substrate-binding protein n=1 Tax=Allobacillus halotolerans TaxID=570278 RepID=A0ABS6GS09_9BACI|nr:ABC transporter substrate-binding protein [Allobacillus halotolerans]MBU6081685.1 ABC transporter substrate-binding protein [Allobacillus halotolerans]